MYTKTSLQQHIPQKKIINKFVIDNVAKNIIFFVKHIVNVSNNLTQRSI